MTYSDDLINRVLHNVKEGRTVVEVSLIFKITKQTIYRWMKLYMNQIILNQFVSPVRQRTNRKCDIYVNSIVEYVRNNKGCSIYDIYLHAVNRQISLSTISRIAKANGISHKRINNKVIGKDIAKIEEERKTFAQERNYDIKDAIFIDETSFCINDHKRYGFGMKGEEINKNWKHKHNKKRLTTIAAISFNGIIATKTVEGSVNKEVYKLFLQENIEQFKHKIVIQDNARCHHARIVKDYAKENELTLRFNPAYSPEFNPIELAFNKVKRKYREYNHENMLEDIDNSFRTITNNNCQEFYKKSNEFINKYV